MSSIFVFSHKVICSSFVMPQPSIHPSISHLKLNKQIFCGILKLKLSNSHLLFHNSILCVQAVFHPILCEIDNVWVLTHGVINVHLWQQQQQQCNKKKPMENVWQLQMRNARSCRLAATTITLVLVALMECLLFVVVKRLVSLRAQLSAVAVKVTANV